MEAHQKIPPCSQCISLTENRTRGLSHSPGLMGSLNMTITWHRSINSWFAAKMGEMGWSKYQFLTCLQLHAIELYML